MKNEKEKIAIVIVTWNNEQEIRDCLNSLQKQTVPAEIIVVDNASNDQTCQIIAEEYPQVTLLKQAENYYLAKSNNMGIKYALEKFNSQYLLIINPDTIAAENLLNELLAVLNQNADTAAVGPLISYFDNEHVYCAGVAYDGFMHADQIGNQLLIKDFLRGRPTIYPVFAVEGTCILFRSKALQQSGLFWERLQMYGEDLELFIRLQKLGWKAQISLRTTLLHKVMASTKQNLSMSYLSFRKRNWLLIALRHYKIRSKLAMLKHYFLA